MFAAVLALLLALPAAAAGQVRLEQVAGGFEQPVNVAAPLGDTLQLFVVELGGRIHVLLDGAHEGVFLDLSARVLTGGERGLLGMALDPAYGDNGRFWVYYTAREPAGAITIEEYRRSETDPFQAAPDPVRTLLRIPHDRQVNHNGGQLMFGPDGMLYALTGDGGGNGDPAGNGQNLTSRDPAVVDGVNHDPLLGKVLRLDARGSGGPAPGNPFAAPAAEVWAFGLRNPYRGSFDRATGDLVIGDVGQSAREEVSWVREADGGGRGANFGWDPCEGSFCPGGAPPGHVAPAFDYPNAEGRPDSVTAGVVVRDPQLPSLLGKFVYADVYEGRIRASTLPAAGKVVPGLPEVPMLVAFGEDGCGRVHVVSLAQGTVWRLAESGECAGPAPFKGLYSPETFEGLPLEEDGGGGDGGGDGGGAGRRTAGSRGLRLARLVAPRQRPLRTGAVTLRATCARACSLRARLLAGGRRSQPVVVRLRAGVPRRVRVPLSLAQRRVLRRRRALTARLDLRATDVTGARVSRALRIRLLAR